MRQGNTRTHTPSPPPCAGMATVGRHDTGQELRRPFTAHDPAHYNPVTSVSLRIPDHNKCSRKTERQTGGCGALNKAVLAQVRGATVDGKRPCGWALITDHTVSMQFAGHNKSGLGGGGTRPAGRRLTPPWSCFITSGKNVVAAFGDALPPSSTGAQTCGAVRAGPGAIPGVAAAMSWGFRGSCRAARDAQSDVVSSRPVTDLARNADVWGGKWEGQRVPMTDGKSVACHSTATTTGDREMLWSPRAASRCFPWTGAVDVGLLGAALGAGWPVTASNCSHRPGHAPSSGSKKKRTIAGVP
mmetsp:Transcript_68617/g.115333  ORF Transcript_68617/g.115333 Transcript_68617/m.115333 type:complete len:300 (+) Transcript_68617:1148-2047(+)